MDARRKTSQDLTGFVDALLQDIIRWLTEVGPSVVFFVTMTETAFFIGLLIPSEATVLVAAALAGRGTLSLAEVTAATLLGGLTGDQIGYVLGRFGGTRAAASGGRVGRMWARYEPRALSLFQKRALVAITLARFVSFVRTLMPWFAGMSRVPYPRFLLFDILGVLGWGLASVAAGYLAGESWSRVADALGVTSALIMFGLIAGGVLLFMRARRGRTKRGDSTPEDHGSRQSSAPASGMLRVGLTGNVASGKSMVADVWRGLGAVVIDADELARMAVQPGTDGLQRVVEYFGNGVLREDGSLDRAALRNLAFASAEKRLALERILHPTIARLRANQEQRLAAEGEHIVVNVIPLLFEVGLTDAVDVIVLVDAPESTRLERLLETRGLTEEEARRVIGSQMPAVEKRARADIVVENDGTLEQLEARAAEAWRWLQQRGR